MRKHFVAGLTLVGVTVIVLLMFTGQSNAKIDKKSVVGMWLFDEDEGNVAKDSSPNGIDGKYISAPKLGEGKFGKGLELNGSNDYVDCGDVPSLNFTGEITVVGWMTTTVIARWNIIAAKEIWDTQSGWALYLSTDRKPTFETSLTQAIGATAVATNTWYHLAGVADDSGNIEVYLNGEEDGRGNSKLTTAKINLFLGARHPNSGAAGITDPFPGILDEVAIFNVALTPDDIQDVMTDGLKKVVGIAAVSSSSKLTATWSSIKKQ